MAKNALVGTDSHIAPPSQDLGTHKSESTDPHGSARPLQAPALTVHKTAGWTT